MEIVIAVAIVGFFLSRAVASPPSTCEKVAGVVKTGEAVSGQSTGLSGNDIAAGCELLDDVAQALQEGAHSLGSTVDSVAGAIGLKSAVSALDDALFGGAETFSDRVIGKRLAVLNGQDILTVQGRIRVGKGEYAKWSAPKNAWWRAGVSTPKPKSGLRYIAWMGNRGTGQCGHEPPCHVPGNPGSGRSR